MSGEYFEMYVVDGSELINYVMCKLFGVIGIILLWNLFLLLFMWKVVLVLVMGNCVVVKFFEEIFSFVMLFVEVMYDVGLLFGVFNLIYGYG